MLWFEQPSLSPLPFHQESCFSDSAFAPAWYMLAEGLCSVGKVSSRGINLAAGERALWQGWLRGNLEPCKGKSLDLRVGLAFW